MEIKFQTKDDSKKQQLRAFLALSGGERIMQFLKFSRKTNKYSGIKTHTNIDNFIVE